MLSSLFDSILSILWLFITILLCVVFDAALISCCVYVFAFLSWLNDWFPLDYLIVVWFHFDMILILFLRLMLVRVIFGSLFNSIPRLHVVLLFGPMLVFIAFGFYSIWSYVWVDSDDYTDAWVYFVIMVHFIFYLFLIVYNEFGCF